MSEREMVDKGREDPRPPFIVRLGDSDDWAITAWCCSCDECHHYLAAREQGKYELYQLDTSPGRRGSRGKRGMMRHMGRFDEITEAVEALEDHVDDDE